MNFQTNGGQKVALTGCWRSQETQSTDSPVSSRPRGAALKKVYLVNDLVQSQEDTLQTHRNLKWDRRSVKMLWNYHPWVW